MLTGLTIGNVRVFEGDPWEFPLAPLTVICGTNSSGKSTLLKVLLLLKQSQAFSQGGRRVYGRLRFAGDEADLGSFRTLVSHEDADRELVLGLTFTDQIPGELLRLSGGHRGRIQDEGSTPYSLKSVFRFRALTQPVNSPSEDEETEPETTRRLHARLVHASFALESEGLSSSWDVRETSSQDGYTIAMPEPVLKPLGLARYLEPQSPSGGSVRFRVRLNGNLPSQIEGRLKASEAQKFGGGEGQSLSFPLPPLVEGATDDLSGTLSRLHYLGPLRAPARRYYVASSDALPTMDAVGEFLPYVLRDRLDTPVTCVLPPLSGEPAQMPLRRALDAWVEYLRSGEVTHEAHGSEVKVKSTRDVLVELQVKGVAGSELHGIADSGFGYSQALPILVRCLLAEQGSSVLIEQPELHLNPALQVRLAEFFVSCVQAGRQVIVETHSEHIVNSIRVLTAEGTAAGLADKVRLLYIDTTQPPTVHDLTIRPDGTVPDWPREFFGEALTLSGRLLAAQRRFIEG